MKYAKELAEWLSENPGATQEEIEIFLSDLARTEKVRKEQERENLKILREKTISCAQNVRELIHEIFSGENLAAGTMATFKVRVTDNDVIVTGHKVKTPGVQKSANLDSAGNITYEEVRNAREYRKRH